jgi:hypothetical protein
VRPLADKWFMTPEEPAEEKRLAHDRAQASEVGSATGTGGKTSVTIVVAAWLFVGIPLAWGIYRTMQSVSKFF